MPNDFDEIAATAAEDKEVPAMRIALDRLLHQQGQPVKAARISV